MNICQYTNIPIHHQKNSQSIKTNALIPLKKIMFVASTNRFVLFKN